MSALVEIRDLVKTFDAPHGRFGRSVGRVAALDGVTLTIAEGETYALVGESGSGKTTLGRCLLRLIEPTSGAIVFEGLDLARIRPGTLREIRRRMQVVFQDPIGSLDPRMAVRDLVAEPLRTHLRLSRPELEARVRELVESVGLAAAHLDRRPHELSGGQCQRVAIARALALSPRLVVLDEPTSSLDVSVQAQILNLLIDLRAEHGLTYLLISHDLSVVRHLADRIGVLYRGRIVEEGPAVDVLERSSHPYTARLIASAPVVGAAGDRAAAAGSVAVAMAGPTGPVGRPVPIAEGPRGCRYAPGCALRRELDDPAACTTHDPELRPVGPDRAAACHFAPVTGAAHPIGDVQ